MQFTAEIDDSAMSAIQNLLVDKTKKHTFLRRTGASVIHNTQERISDGVDIFGKPFVPSIRAKKDGGTTLRDTSRLYNSLTYEIVGDELQVGTNVHYAIPLHFGATIKAKNAEFLRFKGAYGFVSKKEVVLPPRPFLAITDDDQKQMIEILTELLT